MEPQFMSTADRSKLSEGIVGAEDGSTGCCVHVERRVSLCFCFFDLRSERRREHAAFGVRFNGPDSRTAKTEHLRCFLNTVVAMGAGKEDELTVLGVVTMLFRVWEKRVTGDDDGGSVGGRTALNGNAASVGAGEAEEGGEGTGGGFFYDGESGGDLVDMDVCV